MKKQKLAHKKICSELLTLTYGSMIQEIFEQQESCQQVNEQLERMGISIGGRLIDEYLATVDYQSCNNFQQVAESIAKSGFQLFLGI